MRTPSAQRFSRAGEWDELDVERHRVLGRGRIGLDDPVCPLRGSSLGREPICVRVRSSRPISNRRRDLCASERGVRHVCIKGGRAVVPCRKRWRLRVRADAGEAARKGSAVVRGERVDAALDRGGLRLGRGWGDAGSPRVALLSMVDVLLQVLRASVQSRVSALPRLVRVERAYDSSGEIIATGMGNCERDAHEPGAMAVWNSIGGWEEGTNDASQKQGEGELQLHDSDAGENVLGKLERRRGRQSANGLRERECDG